MGWIHGRSPLKEFLSEHSEQALMFIKKSFQTTALDMDSIPWEKVLHYVAEKKLSK